jgi:hypothetical protein
MGERSLIRLSLGAVLVAGVVQAAPPSLVLKDGG